mmetsp:Transcript_15496/g.27752  ORF Transcript_15496/g.27752 Transcript_15496/m.27752 type:complete len:196 (+) Transcript_15496:86-673(+)
MTSSGRPVFAYMTFHVRNEKLAEFCEAAAELLSGARRDSGYVQMDLHRERPWVRGISNEEFSLFMMFQEWATPADLEKHMGTAHASRFNNTVMRERCLVTEPSVSFFGAPLSASDLATLGAEAAAEVAASSAEAGARAKLEASGEMPGNASSLPGGNASRGFGASLGSQDSGGHLSRTNSRLSTLQQSGSMSLKR